MPKAERRARAGAHSQSARLPSKRQFAVQDNAVERVEVGAFADASGSEILQALSESTPESAPLKKKEKLQIKRDLFVERLQSSQSPYSKSHSRRLKRKAQNTIGGGLDDISAAIAAVADEAVPQAVRLSIVEASKAKDAMEDDSSARPRRPNAANGLIGEGKGVPLNQAQRKRALKTEQLRLPVIVRNPEFAKNPFAAIRTHAQNTLVKHERPT